MPLVAFCLSHFLADFIICMCEFDFRQAQLWAAVVAFCSTLMMIVLGIAAKLRRGSDLSES
jgi:hypothetical protein